MFAAIFGLVGEMMDVLLVVNGEVMGKYGGSVVAGVAA